MFSSTHQHVVACVTVSQQIRTRSMLNIVVNDLIITPVRICHSDTTRSSQSKFWLRDVKFLIKSLIWVGANMLYCNYNKSTSGFSKPDMWPHLSGKYCLNLIDLFSLPFQVVEISLVLMGKSRRFAAPTSPGGESEFHSRYCGFDA